MLKPGLVGMLGLLAIACGTEVTIESANGKNDNTADAGTCTATPGPEKECGDSADNDCDGIWDCSDPDCSGVGSCPVCGTIQHPESQPLALPDGEGGSYTSKLSFKGFGQDQKFAAASNLVSVCVDMEHSWIRDLQIDLICPSGTSIALNKFLGQEGDEVFLGTPNDDDDINPVPGKGAKYCWSAAATNAPMLDFANQQERPEGWVLPPGSYRPSDPVTKLMGCPLNGDWTIKVTDLWADDNGYIFSWEISFDPTLVQKCDDPVIQ
jgi:subtilisin-like proprotein convertase family protein